MRKEYSVADEKHQGSKQEEAHLEERTQDDRQKNVKSWEQVVIKMTTGCLSDEYCGQLVISLCYE